MVFATSATNRVISLENVQTVVMEEVVVVDEVLEVRTVVVVVVVRTEDEVVHMAASAVEVVAMEVAAAAAAAAAVVLHRIDRAFAVIAAINLVILHVIVNRIVIKVFATIAINQVT